MSHSPPHSHAPKGRRLNRTIMIVPAVLALVMIVSIVSYVMKGSAGKTPAASTAISTPTASPAPSPSFDPDAGAALPRNRVVAFYAVPGAAATGPAHEITDAMLARLRRQAAVYQQLDPAHPVLAGIDLVVSVPDRKPGPAGTYSHRVDAPTIDRYVEFCRKNNLLLFLDLNFGWSDPVTELNFFRPYLKLPFVHVAVDPEWMFPRHNGVPGVHLSNVRAADLNPLISAVAQMPAEYQVPRKIFMIHQYRPDGDDLANPYNPGAAIIADKRNLRNDSRVDVVIHVDSVGGWPGDIEVKTEQYGKWVAQGMQRFQNFRYGGFKIFYELESKNKLMTPEQVMALQPAPMVITYGN
ncbi:hypothetical protein Daura_00830 [Dactylosporangium aurantiacum]|uniref:Lipoprotein n=1 Tax=Dactylosporangium aurantiacum TaxID=35754 RepID=A0A9Q9IF13_9ACTN|nr:hypothetical protein [Dactylosporangium aurantiacum]MDG6101091.1 hypothetical protein [Dactylosporangium aurantiacum]UWZ54872.1 hypothetical protein Daura_00830 [Dactylosporangium aurantiacum]